MRYLKKTIAAIILTISFAFILTGCEEQIQLKTDLNINDDFSGSRVILLELTKSSFESNSSKSIGEVTSLIKADCPPEMNFEFKEESELYKYTFTINFKDRDEYAKKVGAILGKEAKVNMVMPDTVFSSGTVVKEDFSSEQLLDWFRSTLKENKVTANYDIFSNNGSTVYANGKTYPVADYQIAVSDIAFTKVNGIDVYTDILTSDTFNRSIHIRIPEEEWLIKKDAIQKYVSGNVPKGCTYKVDEGSSEVSIIFSLEDVTLKMLEEKMKTILDSDSYTIKSSTSPSAAAGKTKTDSKKNNSSSENQKPFSIKTGYTEYLDLSSYAGSGSGEIMLNYYISKTDKGVQKVEYLSNGQFINAVLSESQYPDYRSTIISEYSADYIQVSSETEYTAKQIDISTKLKNSKITKSIVLNIAPQPTDSHKEAIMGNLKAYSKDGAEIDYKNDGNSQAVITITISGNKEDVNKTMGNLLGIDNTIEYFKEEGFFKFHKSGIFNETINLNNFITCNENNVNYEVKTGFGEKIDKVADHDANVEISNRSYKISSSDGSFNVTFTTASFNYVLLLLTLLLVAVIAISAILLGKNRMTALKGESIGAIDLNKIKEFSASAITYVNSKAAMVRSSGIIKSGLIGTVTAQESTSNGTSKKAHLGLKIFAILAEICFFLPICVVSCGANSIELNGAKLSFGFDVMEEHIDGNLLCILLAVFPIIIAALLFIKKLQKGFFVELGIGLMSVINIGILLTLHSRITKIVEEYMLDVDFKFGYYLASLSYIALLIGSGILIWLKKKQSDVVKPGEIEHVEVRSEE